MTGSFDASIFDIGFRKSQRSNTALFRRRTSNSQARAPVNEIAFYIVPLLEQPAKFAYFQRRRGEKSSELSGADDCPRKGANRPFLLTPRFCPPRDSETFRRIRMGSGRYPMGSGRSTGDTLFEIESRGNSKNQRFVGRNEKRLGLS